jgi:hypothetical protein
MPNINIKIMEICLNVFFYKAKVKVKEFLYRRGQPVRVAGG